MNQSSTSNPLQSPEAAALLKNPSALKTLLGSPEAKQLLTMLNAQNNAGLKTAAQQAKAGDTTALMAMVNDVMNRPERWAKVEKAIQITRLSRVIRAAMQLFREKGYV